MIVELPAEWRIKQVAYLSRGMYWTTGYIVPHLNRSDGSRYIVFAGGIPSTVDGVYYYRYLPLNRYEIAKVDTGGRGDSVISPGWLTPWASADIDGDSQAELVADNAEVYPGIDYQLACMYDWSSRNHCPDSLVWRGRFDSLTVSGGPLYATDLDQDGRREITLRHGLHNRVYVFEAVRDDSLRLAATFSSNGIYDCALAFGDFDQDGRTEIATAGASWQNIVSIIKCTGDDRYELWDTTPMLLPNGQDVFEAKNIDGTNRNVFFVTFFVWGTGSDIRLYMFEPTQGTRGYLPFLVDQTVHASDDVNGRSTCGDVDGDGIDEILWSIGTSIRIYSCTGPHEFERVWTWNQGVNNSCNLNLYDMNGNGYNEILESGSGVTHIFEIEAIKVLYPNGGQQFRPGDTCRIRWETYHPPRCDSISLFLRSDTAWSLDTIVHGLSPSDTSYRWIVPDVPSNTCRVVAIAYGPGWQFDESDQPFRILPAGVEERQRELVPMTALTDISPNPLTRHTRINFQLREPTRVQLRIRDIAGRTVATLADEALQSGYYYRDWNVGSAGTRSRTAAVRVMSPPSGIYFLTFTAGDCRETKKLILTEGRE